MKFCVLAIVLTFVLFSNVQNQKIKKANPNYNDTLIKNVIVKDIIQKVGTLTKLYVDEDPINDKGKIIENIRDRLLFAIAPMGTNSGKYVDIIMQGIKIMTQENKNGENDSNSIIRRTGVRSKKQLVKSIIDKIKLIAKGTADKAKTEKELVLLLDNIKNKIELSAARRRNANVRVNDHDIKSYANLVTNAIKSVIKKNSRDSLRRSTTKLLDGLMDSIKNLIFEQARSDKHRQNKAFKHKNKSNSVTFDHETSRLNATCDCDCVIQSTCSKIKALSELNCPYEKTKMSLNKLCDRNIDCPDGSDESNCIEQAMNIVHSTDSVISGLRAFYQETCHSTSRNNVVYNMQMKTLKDILKTQNEFVNKLMNDNAYKDSDPNETSNKIANFLSSTVMSLENVFCEVRQRANENVDAELQGLDDNQTILNNHNLNNEIAELTTYVKSCDCNGQFCKEPACSSTCKKICLRKFNLGRWKCKAIEKGDSIAIDLLCDGKYDCHDESDENDCTSGKGTARYQARDILTKILNKILTKTGTKQFITVRNKFLTLYSNIENLMKIGTNSTVKAENLKLIRDRCYSTLVSIYNEVLQKATDDNEIAEVYSFLDFINTEIMVAMKLSHTGNNKAFEDCYCRNGLCAQSQCSKKCQRACPVQSTLTRYSCKKSITSKDISIESDAICNGKKDCPKGDDEIGCKEDMCQFHHLKQFRHKLQGVGDQFKGLALGEVLIAWKEGVTTTLNIAENDKLRPTPHLLKNLVKSMLHDLVMTYAVLENPRVTKSVNPLTEFTQIASIVLESLKLCGK